MPSVYKLIFIASFFIFPLHVLAGTDPIDNTSPVTASVPSQAVSGDTTAPTAPILLRPFDGTVTADTRTEFAWRQSQDPNGNTVIYTFYLDGITTFLGISNLGNSSGVGYSARIEGGDVRLLPTIAISEGQHDWYVTAQDLSGNKSYSATWHFTIDTTPPELTLIDLENYHLPVISNGSTFDIQAPQNVDFVIKTESYSTVYITIVNSEGQTVTTLSQTSDNTGLLYPYYYLDEGMYTVLITATDRAGLSTALPQFFLNLYVVSIPLPSIPGAIRPPIELPPRIVLPPPPSVPTLPATVAKLTARGNIAFIPLLLLALIIIRLLFIILRRKYNLYLVDKVDDPITHAEIYHSHPKYKGQTHYSLDNDRGRIYIPHLNRYSTLTIKHLDTTIALSLSARLRRYTISI